MHRNRIAPRIRFAHHTFTRPGHRKRYRDWHLVLANDVVRYQRTQSKTSSPNMKHEVHNGWKIRFRRNIHMYCHSLTASKHNLELQVPCEDTPDEYVGIWPHDLDLPETRYLDLLVALRPWAQTIQSEYRLYSTRDEYEAGPDENAVDDSSR